MRDLIISAAIMIVLIGGWLIFDSYSENHLSDFADYIIDDIIPAVEEENWEESIAMIADFSDDWHEYRKKALMFLDTDEINEIDFSSGELNSLAEQLIFMYEQQDIKAANIL